MTQLAVGLINPLYQWLGDDGLPLANGFVKTYAAGTTTPLLTYKDDLLTIPNSPTVALDAFGKALLYFQPLAYKIDVQNANGVSIDGYPVDGIPGLLAFDGTSLTAPDGTVALSVNATHFLNSATQPRAIVTNIAQSIPTGVFTALTFATEEANVGGVHSTSVFTSRLTVPTGGDGFYLALGYVDWASNAAGNGRIGRLMKNGATEIVRQSMGPTTAFLPANALQATLQLVATDYLTFEVFQDSGGNLTTVNTDPSRFSLVKLW